MARKHTQNGGCACSNNEVNRLIPAKLEIPAISLFKPFMASELLREVQLRDGIMDLYTGREAVSNIVPRYPIVS